MSLRPCRLRLLVAAIAFGLAGLIAACGDTGPAEVVPGRVDVRIGALVVDAEQARTPAERAQGLSGRESLDADAGMLFVYEDELQPGFWMREMRFPLDFIWISAEGIVVDLTEDVPPPAPSTADSDLPLYRPDTPARYVLEVNAGLVREAAVSVGDTVQFEPDISQEEAP